MGAGVTFVIIVGVVGVTWLLADALDAVDAQVEELFGDQPHLPEGLAALPAETGGEGHERGSAAEESEIAPHGSSL